MSTAAAPPRAMRVRQGRWIAGVCTGLAENLRWPVSVVRLAFVVATLANGVGIVAYLAYWAVLPAKPTAARRGTDGDFARMLAFGAVVIGFALLSYSFSWDAFSTYVPALLVLALGLAILLRQRSGDAPPLARVPGTWTRTALGMSLVAAGLITLLVGEVGWRQGGRALVVALLLLGGVAVLALPWLVRTFQDLTAERRARIREQERAELAGHIHDSVLQTLTLIQRHADDPDRVRRLSRAEERRLRSWLYEPVGLADERLGAALQHEAARIEQEYDAAIEVVLVGDRAMGNAPARALLAASAEAMVNAAKHAGGQISVYCEVSEAGADVYVRDRGPGFDPDRIPPDRHGIRDSITGRLQDEGGKAEFVTRDPGTEVHLSIPWQR